MLAKFGAVVVVVLGILVYFYGWKAGRPIRVDDLNDAYDFVVVGSGSAGGIVATRLFEANASVLLIEAGPMDTDYWSSKVPGLVLSLHYPGTDWQYYTQPQHHTAKALRNRQNFWVRGKILGGSSTTNWMQYVRGSPHDFDEWEEQGNPGWGYKSVLPLFKRSERIDIAHIRKSKFHGTKGPVCVGEGARSQLGKYLAKAIRALGYKFNEDTNTDDYQAFSYTQLTACHGLRYSTSEAFIRPAMEKGMQVLVNSFVRRVILSKNKDGTQTASGVEVESEGRLLTIKANKEVVLSGGSINSPQILMLSGIGPRKELEKAKVEVAIVNENVGSHLEDHLMSWLVFNLKEAVGLEPNPFYPSLLTKAKRLAEYLIRPSGSQLSTTPLDIIGFSKSGLNDDRKYPDIQTYLMPTNHYHKEYIDQMNIKPEVQEYILSKPAWAKGQIYLNVQNLHGKSRGTIRLNASDVYARPIINMPYFQEPMDKEVIKIGLKNGIKIIQHGSLGEHKGYYSRAEVKECSHLTLLSDEYLDCTIEHLGYTSYHPTSTCRMGPDPKNSVVDSRLRVHGVPNLRVIDASIMPHVTSGNTNAASMMIGEKGFDLISEDHQLPKLSTD